MKIVSLLPADTYTIVNKSIITEDDKKNIISLYEPIIGPIAVSLYFTLLRDITLLDIISKDYTHYHLMTIMKSNLEVIRLARESLEGVGLLKTYFKEGEPNSYVYELYSPLSPKEFFASPIFNITLYSNLGKTEYDLLKAEYELPKIDLKDYEDISKELNNTYESISSYEAINAKEKKTLGVKLESNIDFDLLMSSMPKGLIKENILTKKMKDLIEQLAFIYNLDTLKMIELLRTTITERGTFDKEELRKSARKYYQYNNSGQLPTIIYRTQPEYLKSPEGDNSALGKIIYMFENTSPYDFLRMIDQEFNQAVVNVLIDYVLKKNNNKLQQAYVETIASQWKRCNIETAKEAMELAKKENKKIIKKIENKTNKKVSTLEPAWFNEQISKEEISDQELAEVEDLLKDFR